MTSLEQRQTIKSMVNQGIKCPKIAEQVGCSVHTVRKWKSIIKKGVHCIPRWVGQKQVL